MKVFQRKNPRTGKYVKMRQIKGRKPRIVSQKGTPYRRLK